MKDSSIQNALARLMLVGVLVAAAVMLLGLILFMPSHAWIQEGDKVFTGEPSCLRDPAAMAASALHPGTEGHNRSIIMIGVLLLLLNPVARVAFAAAGFAAQRDSLYASISLGVLAILIASFFL